MCESLSYSSKSVNYGRKGTNDSSKFINYINNCLENVLIALVQIY